MIELANGRYSVGVDPGTGGSLAWFRTGAGIEIFRSARVGEGGATDSACFPMVPFCNRVRNRRFDVAGLTITLAANTADGLRTAHGFGWRSEWTVVERSEVQAVIRHEHDGGDWPWNYVAQQTISVDRDGLTIVLSVRNLSTSTMPAGLGLHPYFPLRGGTTLRLIAQESSVLDDDGFPIPDQNERALLRAAAGGTLPPVSGNRYLSGAEGPVVVSDPGGGHVVTMLASSNCRHYALHCEPDNGLFCVEPMTHRVGALNAIGAEREMSGLRALGPGATLEMTMRCGVESVAP